MSNVYARFRSSLVIGLTVATMVGAIAGVQLANVGTANAAACDKVNIIYCGLDGNTDAEYVNSLKAKLAAGTDNGHSDLKTVYNWAGATDGDLTGLNTTNTKVGTLYRNGDVKVGDTVVANDAWVSARFTQGAGFVQVTDGVWARKTTTSFANDSVKALVHYDENNQVDFVVMVDCGNAVKVTPVKVVKPQPSLVCSSLVFTAVPDKNLTYRFVARATASNTTITGYTFTLSDGTTEVVTSAAETAELVHQFAENGKDYTVSVAVNSADAANVTSAACKVTLTTLKVEECKPGVVKGSPACNECKPGVATGSAECVDTPEATPAAATEEAPTELVNAGPGAAIAGLFAGTSALGAAGHRFITRRFRRG